MATPKFKKYFSDKEIANLLEGIHIHAKYIEVNADALRYFKFILFLIPKMI